MRRKAMLIGKVVLNRNIRCRGVLLRKRIISAVLVFTICVICSLAIGGVTEIVSVNSEGDQGSGYSVEPDVSDDGRYVVFYAAAEDLVPDDTNGMLDIFVHDRFTNETTRVSISSDGEQANGQSAFPTISGDGRIVAFHSSADNLVTDDRNSETDMFAHDRETGFTVRVSVDSKGKQSNENSSFGAVSGNGQYVVFQTAAQLSDDDVNNTSDIYMHDLLSRETVRVSVGTGGFQLHGASVDAAISYYGEYVAFSSLADNVDPIDIDNRYDIYVRDILSDETVLVSPSSSNDQSADEDCELPVISADGQKIAFISEATNLIEGEQLGIKYAFLYDRTKNLMRLMSRNYCGEPGDQRTDTVAITPDGQWVVFYSAAQNLVPGGSWPLRNIFLRNTDTNQILEVSEASDGSPADGDSFDPALSNDGHIVVFSSVADNLVEDDMNDTHDIFAHELECISQQDLDNSGSVGALDLLALLGCWGLCTECAPDFDGNGSVGASDLLILLANWGPCP